MQVNAENFQTKWRTYTENCRTEINKAIQSRAWTEVQTDKNIYLIVPDNEKNFENGKPEKGPITKEQLKRRLKDIHQRYNAEGYEGCLQSLEENMQGVPQNVPIVITLAFVRPQSMPPMIMGAAIMIKGLFSGRMN